MIAGSMIRSGRASLFPSIPRPAKDFKSMTLRTPLSIAILLSLNSLVIAQEENNTAESKVSFLNDVGPILIENCVGCHNPKKAENDYDITTFAKLAKGGLMGEGIMLEPGDLELSYFIELIQPEGAPRMPWKAEPLPEEIRKVIEQWVLEGAFYDGENPEEDWVALLNTSTAVAIPERYPFAMPITALAFAPSGDRIVSSGYHELNMYQIETGELISRTPGVGERVYDAAFSPDGSLFATASGNPGRAGFARLWIVNEDGTLADPQTLVESDDAVFALAFSGSGDRLAVAGADRTLRVFNVETGETLAEIEDHADWILDVAFSPDGSRLATASRDKTSKLFDAERYESLVTFPGHAETVHCVGFVGGDGKRVASGGADGRIRIWNPAEDAKQVREVRGFNGPIFDLKVFNEGARIAASGQDTKIRLINSESGAIESTLEGHRDWVYRLTIGPDGSSIATGSWDGEVKIWDPQDGSLKTTILAVPGHGDARSADAQTQ